MIVHGIVIKRDLIAAATFGLIESEVSVNQKFFCVRAAILGQNRANARAALKGSIVPFKRFRDQFNQFVGQLRQFIQCRHANADHNKFIPANPCHKIGAFDGIAHHARGMDQNRVPS